MITELMEMFYRTHTKSTEEYDKDFQKLIQIFLTDIAASMYTYMLMLEHVGRKEEFYILKGYRDTLFILRDQTPVDFNTMVLELKALHIQINIHTVLLKITSEKAWEAETFRSLLNNIGQVRFAIQDYIKD